MAAPIDEMWRYDSRPTYVLGSLDSASSGRVLAEWQTDVAAGRSLAARQRQLSTGPLLSAAIPPTPPMAHAISPPRVRPPLATTVAREPLLGRMSQQLPSTPSAATTDPAASSHTSTGAEGELSAAAVRERAERELAQWRRQSGGGGAGSPLAFGAPHPSANASLGAGDPGPPAPLAADPVLGLGGGPAPATSLPHPAAEQVRVAEERLRDTVRETQLLQARTGRLKELQEQRLRDADQRVTETHEVRRREHAEREEAWRKELADLEGEAARQEELARTRQAGLREREAAHAEEEARQDAELRERTLASEDSRRRTELALESKLRREVAEELGASIGGDVERRLRERITAEMQVELQGEFVVLCETMRDEVERARGRMEEEITRELEPVVDRRLRAAIHARVEADVQRAVAQQMSDVAHATQLLHAELRTAVEQRDAAQAELDARRRACAEEEAAVHAALRRAREDAGSLAEQLAEQQETLRRHEEQRALYPLLRELTGDPAPWVKLHALVDETRRDNRRLRQDADASRAEIDGLRELLMRRVGAAPPPQQPSDAEQLPPPPLTALPCPPGMEPEAGAAAAPPFAAASTSAVPPRPVRAR